MNDQIAPQPLTVLLSREELLAILDALQARFIPGLDPDPLGELTPDGRELALTVARRALQARELAQTGADGALKVYRTLLEMVGACAYSQSAVVAYHWPAGAAAAIPFYGHIRADEAVTHTRPADVLHRFTRLPSKAALIGQVLDFCECTGPAVEESEFAVPRTELAKARDLANAGKTADAATLLTNSGIPAPSAQAFAQTLAATPRVSAIQTLKHKGDREVESKEFTLIEDGQRAWCVMPAPGSAADGPMVVRATAKEQVSAALAEWL